MTRRRDGRAVSTIALVPVRWSGLALAVAFGVLDRPVEVAVAMLVALAQVVGWRSRLPLAWEIATSVAAVLAAVSSFLRLYERISWWDVPVHFALTGLLAVLVVRAVRTPAPSGTQIAVTGAVLAVVWELMEVAGWLWVDRTVEVAPADTAVDLLAGLAGTVAAAWCWRRGWGRAAAPAP